MYNASDLDSKAQININTDKDRIVKFNFDYYIISYF